MTASHISGPSIVSGERGIGSTAGSNPEAGPSVMYQGNAIIDVRFPYQPGQTGPGHVRGLLSAPYIASVDAVPSAAGAAMIAPAQTATSNVPLTLAAVNSTGIGVAFPLVPEGSNLTAANVVRVLALDPGFTTISVVAGSTTATVPVGVFSLFPAHFVAGMAVLVGSLNNAWTLARIINVTGMTLTFDTPMPATNGAAVIALANAQFRTNEAPVAKSGYLTRGAGTFLDAKSGLARGVSVTTSAVSAGAAVRVVGYDVYSFPMTEIIPCATASTFYSNKCFKFITSATPTGTVAGTMSIGTSDLFGFHTRSDQWEYTDVFWAGAFMASSAGWYAADPTSPATSSTKDVRGAVQVSALGPNGTASSANSSNGTRRLQMFATIPADNLLGATVANPAPLFGTAQA